MTDFDYFIDYCEANGLDYETEDFYAWLEYTAMAAEDAAVERGSPVRLEAARAHPRHVQLLGLERGRVCG